MPFLHTNASVTTTTIIITVRIQPQLCQRPSTDGNQVCREVAQRSLCTITTTSRAHHTTTTTISHLVQHLSLQSCRLKFTTSNLFWRRPLSFHASILDHTCTKPPLIYQDQTQRWMISLDMHPDQTACPGSKQIPSTAPSLSGCRDFI